MRPFFSVVTVSYKHAWSMTKTARSVFRQKDADFEYVIIDGASNDGTLELTEFWKQAGLVHRSSHDPDTGVYDAMNKALDLATGKYLCFMNSGDVFASDDVLAKAKAFLETEDYDGCMAWGQLGDNVWASWQTGEAFKMASLGFCHQALFARTDLLRANRFDSRKHKTDSDTLQLGGLYADGANIPIVPEVWAIRGAEPGISANLDKTRTSILDTLTSEYSDLDQAAASALIAFRRKCTHVPDILQLLKTGDERLRTHLAYTVLDTLFQKQSAELPAGEVQALKAATKAALGEDWGDAEDRLLVAQTKRTGMIADLRAAKADLKTQTQSFGQQEDTRMARLDVPAAAESHPAYQIGLTSFPARISTLHFVIRSLVEQSVKPAHIHLFLGQDEIPNANWLPSQLRAFEASGLKLHFVESTRHQYDKFTHTEHFDTQMPYVIVDDDVIYQPYSMERLLSGHRKYPKAVIGNRCHMMTVANDGSIGPYSDWQREARTPEPSFNLVPTGAGGVLYPPGFFDSSAVTDTDQIMRYAPYADDVWLKFNALAQDRPTFATELSSGSEWYHRYTPTMRAGTLMAENVELGLNDIQIARCGEWLSQTHADWQSLLRADELERA
ncbi:MAG: glycosyltransferase [Henriciella sp.]